MKVPPEGTRMNVTTTAALFSMDPAHFRRLVRRGVLPRAKRTSRNMPYYDHVLIERIHDVLREGVGCNGDEVAFYRRRTKTLRLGERSNSERQSVPKLSAFVESVVEGCRQLGVEEDHLSPARIRQALMDEFGSDYEERSLEEVIPSLVRRMQGEK